MKFYKYHGLGNDYVVVGPADFADGLTEKQIRRICQRNFGIGSDGILFGSLARAEGGFGLRIFNPDGSEAEKSGNGIRIFARYLVEAGYVQSKEVTPWLTYPSSQPTNPIDPLAGLSDMSSEDVVMLGSIAG